MLKTYFRQNKTISDEKNILALFGSIDIDFNVGVMRKG